MNYNGFMSSDENREELFDNDLNISQIIYFFRESFRTIFISFIIFSILGIAYSLSLEDTYKSESTVVPSALSSTGSSSGLSAISSLAGLNMGENNLKVLVAKEMFNTNFFIDKFIEENNLAPFLVASKSWDKKQNKLILDTEIYDPTTKTWLYTNQIDGEKGPTIGELREAFISNFQFDEDVKTQMITLSYSNISPYFARTTLVNLIDHVNKIVREEDLKDSKDRYNFLLSEFSKSNVVRVKQSISSLLEEELKVMSLLSTKEYAFKVIDPPSYPERKSGPFRSIIVILFALMGVFFGLIYSFIRKYFFNN